MAFNTLENWLVVIPARLNSQRLPSKPLQTLGGRPLIQRVYQNLEPLAALGAKLVVAVDNQRVQDVCAESSIPCFMTREDHPSGTDRCNEVAQMIKLPYVMNVQGDEPFVNLDDLRRLAKVMEQTQVKMGTLAIQSTNSQDYLNPNCVKIARAEDGHALYFSRSPIPYDRDLAAKGFAGIKFWQHLGVYAFSARGLTEFCSLRRSGLEQVEKLEQLRAIDSGWRIVVAEAQHHDLGIDTPEDLARAEALWQSRLTASKS